MATEAEAAREAQAKVISAEGEKKSAQAIKVSEQFYFLKKPDVVLFVLDSK